MRFLLAVTLLFTPSILSAQTKAKILAEGIISTGKDYCTAFSPDGKTIYFVRRDPRTGNDNIMSSRFVNGEWQIPDRLSFSTIHNDTDPTLSPDGKTMYFVTRRSNKSDELLEQGDIWFVKKTDTGWGEPAYLASEINEETAIDGYAMLTHNNRLYFFSARDGGFGKHDIYVADHYNGQFKNVRNLGPTVNTEYYDSLPYIDPEETIMIHYRNDPGTFGGGDLYVRYNVKRSWSQAINLGPNVNTEISEITPYLSHDKQTLYFSRVHKDGRRNIYYIDVRETAIKMR